MENVKHSNRWLTMLDKVTGVIERVFLFFSAALLIVMTAAMCFTVHGRFLFDYAGAWSVEFSEYVLLYVTFLAAPWLVRQGEHIKIDLLTSNLPEKGQRRFRIFSYAICLLACIFIAYYGFMIAWDHYVRGVTIINILYVPKYILLLIIPVSSFVILLELVNQWAQEGRRRNQS